MQQNYTAVVKQDGQWWIGRIEEVPGVNCQETSREELLDTLRVTLAEHWSFKPLSLRERGWGEGSAGAHIGD